MNSHISVCVSALFLCMLSRMHQNWRRYRRLLACCRWMRRRQRVWKMHAGSTISSGIHSLFQNLVRCWCITWIYSHVYPEPWCSLSVCLTSYCYTYPYCLSVSKRLKTPSEWMLNCAVILYSWIRLDLRFDVRWLPNFHHDMHISA